MEPSPQATQPGERIAAIDALRGFDMFWIIGADALVRAVTQRLGTPGALAFGRQFEHVEWEGFRFYDLIFPLFLFMVGTVIPFSLGRQLEKGADRRAVYAKILRRGLVIVLFGLIYNNLLAFDFSNFRYTGVLQRIGLCYMAAALLFLNLGRVGLVTVVGAILVGYWAALTYVPGHDYSMEASLTSYVDRQWLPGRLYYGYGDNEGLLSNLTAVATTLIGCLAGIGLRSGAGAWTKVGALAAAGSACLAAGYAWGQSFPIIKNIWTSSFVLVTGGWSLLLLALFYAVIDVLGYRKWAFFFIVIGANAITIYVARRIIPFDKIAEFFVVGFMTHAATWAPVILIAASLAIKWLFLLFLYRHKIFLRV